MPISVIVLPSSMIKKEIKITNRLMIIDLTLSIIKPNIQKMFVYLHSNG